MVDFDALDRKIKRSPYTQKYLATRLYISVDALKGKLLGQTDFKLSEVANLAHLLNLSDEELLKIFFKKVHCDFDIYQPGGTKG